MEVLRNLIVLIISQHICIWNHYIVHIKLNVICELYLNKAGKYFLNVKWKINVNNWIFFKKFTWVTFAALPTLFIFPNIWFGFFPPWNVLHLIYHNLDTSSFVSLLDLFKLKSKTFTFNFLFKFCCQGCSLFSFENSIFKPCLEVINRIS